VPTTSARLPNRSCHSACERTITFGAPGWGIRRGEPNAQRRR
jgi:hypothetical protein